jgi:hypothetical protein
VKIKNATEVVVSVFGIVLGLAGIEHGIGEIFQGNIAPRRNCNKVLGIRAI